LRGYVLSTYSARKLGLRSTGNAGGVHNLTIDPGKLDYQALVKELGTGLLVTELMGQGVNMVTGDYSRGAPGSGSKTARFNIRLRKSPSPVI